MASTRFLSAAVEMCRAQVQLNAMTPTKAQQIQPAASWQCEQHCQRMYRQKSHSERPFFIRVLSTFFHSLFSVFLSSADTEETRRRKIFIWRKTKNTFSVISSERFPLLLHKQTLVAQLCM